MIQPCPCDSWENMHIFCCMSECFLGAPLPHMHTLPVQVVSVVIDTLENSTFCPNVLLDPQPKVICQFFHIPPQVLQMLPVLACLICCSDLCVCRWCRW